MYNELDTVVLTHDAPENSLKEGDVGVVVHIHKENEAFEVEFVDAKGETVAILTLDHEDIRPMQSREILHVRDLGLAANV